LLCKGQEDCLCFRHNCCIALNTPSRGLGCTTDQTRGEICKVGVICCDMGLIIPTKLCAGAGQCLCCYNVASIPCSKEYVPDCVCTFCCFCQCCPKCGCCVAPPPCPALEKVLRSEPPTAMISMERQ
jgi:hypothetical protein